MSTETFEVSYPAQAQLESLPLDAKAALKRLFATDSVERSPNTRPTGDGRFVSRLGSKRVLWHRQPDNRPEILAIVDRSFAQA